jgi:predicted ferric reductase
MNIGQCPTRGQALLIFYFVTLNTLLCFATYRLVPVDQQTKYANRERQLGEIMANRIGVIALSNMALTILYATRNNFLLWITRWPRSTFLLIHHWLGYIVIVEMVTHASLYLHLYLKGLSGDYAKEHKEQYWQFGTLAIVSIAAIGPLSSLPVRQKAYEFFKLFHNLLAVLILIGIFLHVFLKNGEKGFHNWVYAAIAALVFDRAVRIFRVARNGLRTAEITVIDEDYVRVDVRGVTAEGHAYVYFPTLSWRVWESHPFSVAASVHNVSSIARTLQSGTSEGSMSPQSIEEQDFEKAVHSDKAVPVSASAAFATSPLASSFAESATSTLRPVAGATFFVRRQKGMTSLLASRKRLPILIESSYGSLSDLAHHPNLIAIAGGVGVVTVLPVLRSHAGRSKLYWSMRNATLLDPLREDLAMFDKEVCIGKRLDIADILEREIAGDNGKGACVVVSGPGALADAVRKIVVEIGRRKGAYPVRFVDESFN